MRGSVAETDGKLICSGRLSFDAPGPLLVLTPREIDQESSSVIRFATTDPAGIDFRVQEAIRDWNNHTPQCPIEIIDYSVYGGEDKNASAVKLMADMVAGNIPDIYDFSLTAIDSIPSSAQMPGGDCWRTCTPISTMTRSCHGRTLSRASSTHWK